MNEFLFVWIEEFRNLKDVGFNLSNQYKIEYIPDSNKLLVKFLDDSNAIDEKEEGLHFIKKDHYLDEFFKVDEENISNINQINAIIGQNSSGKSNVIDFILTAISKGGRNRIQSNYLLIFKENNELCFCGRTKGRSLSSSDLICLNSQVRRIKSEDTWSSIFYSNVADNKQNIFESSQLLNYSFNTMNKLQSNKISFVESSYFMNVWKRINSDKSPSRQIRFIFNPISFIKTKKESTEEKIVSILERYDRAIYDASTSNSNRFFYGLTINLLAFLHENNFDIQILLDKVIVTIDTKGRVAQEIRILHPFVLDFLLDINVSNLEIKNVEEIENYLIILRKLKENINKYNLGIVDKLEESIVVDFNDDFKEIISNNQKAFNNSNLITHDWTQLSSGLKAYINLFSQLFDASNKVNKSNVLICIDEGDLYLHPEWQKNFLNDLIWYLSLIFKGKNVHLVLTSHSPFLISDLPKENIILIDKDGVPDRQLNQKSSFGANIHQLYNNQFFLTNGAIGLFAKNKISALLKIIKESEELDVKRIISLINMIGEPVLRVRLEEELRKRVQVLDKERLIQWHESQITKLRN